MVKILELNDLLFKKRGKDNICSFGAPIFGKIEVLILINLFYVHRTGGIKFFQRWVRLKSGIFQVFLRFFYGILIIERKNVQRIVLFRPHLIDLRWNITK